MARTVSQTARLHAQGFDLSRAIPFEHAWRVRCSQCDAVCVNGIPCHERGCPNDRNGECFECGTTINRRARYCDDCAEPRQ